MKNGRYVENGWEHWYQDDVLHRLDGPAAIRPNGSMEWRIKGELHRLDGPAVIRSDGSKEWWVDGKSISFHHLSIMGLINYPKDGFTVEQIALLRIMR